MEKRILNVLFGPPKFGEERTTLSFFFSLPGKHFVCGGTTANAVADYLNKPLEIELVYIRKDVPPVGKIDGVDLVTEGIVTLKRVEKLLSGRERPEEDGASLIYKAMQEADEIELCCGFLTEGKKELVSSLVALLRERKKTVRIMENVNINIK